MDRVVGRVNPHLPEADERDWPDIAFLQAVCADDVENGFFDLFEASGERKSEDFPRVEQPPDMLVEPEHGRAAVFQSVAANSFEISRTVMESMGEDMHFRLVPVHHLAVEPDFLAG